MPTYVYRREDGTTFEVFQRISDDALTTDPETGQSVVRVIGGGAGLIFKGTGFYQTDYVKKSGVPSESSDKGSSDSKSSESKASDAGSSDSKPSAKKETAVSKKSSD